MVSRRLIGKWKWGTFTKAQKYYSEVGDLFPHYILQTALYTQPLVKSKAYKLFRTLSKVSSFSALNLCS